VRAAMVAQMLEQPHLARKEARRTPAPAVVGAPYRPDMGP
jgi:hypothetical protein